MIEKREWHQPKFLLLDAGQTAQGGNPDGGATDIDACLSDPQGTIGCLEGGDLPEVSENFSAWGNFHAQADAHS